MIKQENQKNCAVCDKKLNFWFTSLKKYEGKKVCSNCAWSMAKEELKNGQKNNAPKRLNETRVTCLSCGNVWHYGKTEVLENMSGAFSNLGKSMMCCSGCTPSLLIPDKKVTDLNKCPKCGSRAIKKEVVTHELQ